MPFTTPGLLARWMPFQLSRKSIDLAVMRASAQGVNAKYREKYLGTLSDIGTYSFHETKNFICGEGGSDRTQSYGVSRKGGDCSRKGHKPKPILFAAEVDKYTWVDIGSSLLPSDILAAFLFAQLENMEIITKKRQEIYRHYEERLRPLAQQGLIRLPVVPPECESNYHMFYIMLNSLDERTKLIEHLKARSILAVFHYVALHSSPMGLAMGYRAGMLPVTESISERLFVCPMYYEMQEGEVESVVDEIFKFFRVL